MNNLYVSIDAACKITSLGRTTMYKLISLEQVDAVKVGRRTLVKLASLEQLGMA